MAARSVRHSNVTRERTDDAGRQTGSLIGLAITLLLIVIGLYLINILRAQAYVQDCVISGHGNCESLQAHIANLPYLD